MASVIKVELTSSLTLRMLCADGFTSFTGTVDVLWDQGAFTCLSETSIASLPSLPHFIELYIWCDFSRAPFEEVLHLLGLFVLGHSDFCVL